MEVTHLQKLHGSALLDVASAMLAAQDLGPPEPGPGRLGSFASLLGVETAACAHVLGHKDGRAGDHADDDPTTYTAVCVQDPYFAFGAAASDLQAGRCVLQPHRADGSQCKRFERGGGVFPRCAATAGVTAAATSTIATRRLKRKAAATTTTTTTLATTTTTSTTTTTL